MDVDQIAYAYYSFLAAKQEEVNPVTESTEPLVEVYVLDPDLRAISVGSIDNLTPNDKRVVSVPESVALYLVSSKPALFALTPPAKASHKASTPPSEE